MCVCVRVSVHGEVLGVWVCVCVPGYLRVQCIQCIHDYALCACIVHECGYECMRDDTIIDFIIRVHLIIACIISYIVDFPYGHDYMPHNPYCWFLILFKWNWLGNIKWILLVIVAEMYTWTKSRLLDISNALSINHFFFLSCRQCFISRNAAAAKLVRLYCKLFSANEREKKNESYRLAWANLVKVHKSLCIINAVGDIEWSSLFIHSIPLNCHRAIDHHSYMRSVCIYF